MANQKCTVGSLPAGLQDDRQLRRTCGFRRLPCRSTFNRFIRRLRHHPDLVEQALNGLTEQLREHLPDLGRDVTIDSTTVRSHSNPNRKTISDPEASWAVKNSTRSPNGKEAAYGYKLHMVADANYGIPLALISQGFWYRLIASLGVSILMPI